MLPRGFFARDVLEVAPDLVGVEVRHGPVRLRITETEAYRWPGDTACHARHGRTERTDPLFGPPGLAYVYLCYGLHNLLNVVTGRDGDAQAVLVRAAEVVGGQEVVRSRRSGRSGPKSLAGPGKVGQALGIDVSFTRSVLYQPGGVELYPASRTPSGLVVGPRVGIDYADLEHRELPWRWADADSRAVTRRKGLSG